VGTLALGALGLLADDDAPTASAGAAPSGGSPGAPGGYTVAVPEGFKPAGTGRWLYSEAEQYGVTRSVEMIRLDAIAGMDDPGGKVRRFWNQRIASDWNKASPNPFVMRRFVSNGARAHFTGGEVRAKDDDRLAYVSVYLVEAGDRLEPLVFIQQYADPTMNIKSAREMSASLSWHVSHAWIEKALAGVAGSPVGLPLVSDDEVSGKWVYSTSNALQWVNTLTGSTTMTAVSYWVRYTFGDDHDFAYSYGGASGQVGALQYGAEKDEGTWEVKHDLLLLTGAQRSKKYMIAAAGAGPDGKRYLLLMSEGSFAIAPFAVSRGELFVTDAE
jgi:hypothetical protein